MSVLIKLCKFCGSDKEICRSHAMPRSFFINIQRQDSGKSILLSDGAEKIRKTINSGQWPILCKECENYFNINFDSPIDQKLNLLGKPINPKVHLVFLDHPKIIASFILSVIWRASMSENEIYKSFELPRTLNKKIQDHLKSPGTDNPFEFSTFRFERLIDRIGNFSEEEISQVVIAPYCAHREKTRKLEISFIGRGYLFSTIYPRYSSLAANKHGFLYRDRPKMIKQTDIFDQKSLIKLGVISRMKAESGHITF
jgi:hypothetical protein|tara:strand:- start:175 stop:939 length:765 start_codon:yes stop_codon:yes gene_type:complete